MILEVMTQFWWSSHDYRMVIMTEEVMTYGRRLYHDSEMMIREFITQFWSLYHDSTGVMS